MLREARRIERYLLEDSVRNRSELLGDLFGEGAVSFDGLLTAGSGHPIHEDRVAVRSGLLPRCDDECGTFTEIGSDRPIPDHRCGASTVADQTVSPRESLGAR